MVVLSKLLGNYLLNRERDCKEHLQRCCIKCFANGSFQTPTCQKVEKMLSKASAYLHGFFFVAPLSNCQLCKLTFWLCFWTWNRAIHLSIVNPLGCELQELGKTPRGVRTQSPVVIPRVCATKLQGCPTNTRLDYLAQREKTGYTTSLRYHNNVRC